MPSLIASEENTKRISQMMCHTVTWFDDVPDKRAHRKLIHYYQTVFISEVCDVR